MVSVDFGHTSNPDKSGFVSSQRLVNAFSVPAGDAAKTKLPVFSVPGTVRFDTGTSGLNGPCRGLAYIYGKGLLAVGGANLALFDSAGAPTAISGTLSGSDLVSIAVNQRASPQAAIVAASGYYVFDTADNSFAAQSIAALPAPNYCCFIDGYVVFSIADGRFFHSGINDAKTVNALAYASKQSLSDGNVAVRNHRGALLVLGQESMEVWEDVGTIPFAFSRIRASIPVGCMAAPTIKSLAENTIWLDHQCQVRKMSASEPERISNGTIERAIEALSVTDRAQLRATTSALEGHNVYTLTSPYWSYEFDLVTGLWHERKSNSLNNWFAQCSANFPGNNIIGSSQAATLHRLDATAMDESGEPFTVIAQSATVHAFPNGLIFDELAVDFVPGVGVTGSGSPAKDDAADPQLMLDWSDDGGHTWAGGLQAALGRVGERSATASFYCLGACDRQGRIFRLSCSASVMRGLIQAEARVRKIGPRAKR
jgi:hypothetical protein